jgi:hypothetical protein
MKTINDGAHTETISHYVYYEARTTHKFGVKHWADVGHGAKPIA